MPRGDEGIAPYAMDRTATKTVGVDAVSKVSTGGRENRPIRWADTLPAPVMDPLIYSEVGTFGGLHKSITVNFARGIVNMGLMRVRVCARGIAHLTGRVNSCVYG